MASFLFADVAAHGTQKIEVLNHRWQNLITTTRSGKPNCWAD
jgi:hypothetical protein